jgi:hypothetical protein
MQKNAKTIDEMHKKNIDKVLICRALLQIKKIKMHLSVIGRVLRFVT